MKRFFLAILLICSLINIVSAQDADGDYRTADDGAWNDVSTWQVYNNGWVALSSATAGAYVDVIPSSASGAITIRSSHNVSIPNGFSVSINETTIASGGLITVINGGALAISNVANALMVNGTLIGGDGSSITNSASNNIVFNSGSTYIHNFTTTQGVIPRATWDSNSEVQIRGYTTFTTATSAGNWSQSFGNFEWRCAAQTTTISLAGLLTMITGDFEITDTNSGTLQLSTSQRPTINISGDFTVEGSSQFIVASTGATPGTIVNIGGDFNFTPTNASSSYIASSTGTVTINIAGDFNMDAPSSTLYLVNSTGSSGSGTLNITGDFSLQSGTITEGLNDSATAGGRIWFTTSGGGTLHSFSNAGTISNRIAYRLVSASDTLHIQGESQLIGNNGSSYTQNGGVLIVESIHADGAIQTGSGAGNGNIRTVTRTFSTGSRIIYAGSAAQAIGNGQVSTASVIIDNPSGVSLNNTTLGTVSLAGLTIEQGNLFVENDNLSVNSTGAVVQLNGGDIVVNSDLGARSFTTRNLILSGGDVIMTGTTGAITLTVNEDLDLLDGDITISNASAIGTFNTFGDIDLSGGDITLSTGTANITSTIRGDITGTGFFIFEGANNLVNLLGNGNLSRNFPVNTATTLRNFILNRPSAIVNFPVDLTVNINLTIRAGSLVMDGDLSITGDLNVISGSTLTFSDRTLELGSQFNNALFGGLLFANSGSRLLLTGSGALDTLFFAPTGNTLGTLKLDRPTTGTLVRLTSTLTVIDSLLLEDGIFHNTSGLTLNSGAIVMRHSAASFTGIAPLGGDYDLLYEGTALTTGIEADGALQNLTSNLNGILTLDIPLTLSGNLVINSGTFTSGANNISMVQFENNGTFNAPSGNLTLTDSFTNTGTFNRNNGTVTFAGTTALVGTVPVFHHIVIDNGAELQEPATLELRGHFTNNGTFNGTSGTVIFSGTALQNFAGSSSANFYNVQITNSVAPVSVSMENSANLSGILTLGSSVDFDADGSANTSVLRLLSLDDEPSITLPVTGGSIAAIPTNSSVAGNITVERFMGAKGTYNRYFSSPVTGATISQLSDDFNTKGIRYYDETVLGAFSRGYKDAFGILQPGRGYLAYMWNGTIDVTWDVNGPITPSFNQGNVQLPITYTASTPPNPDWDGWNLVGNPYPSGIQWNNDISDWLKTNIAPIIYVPDIAAGVDRTWNAITQTGDLPNGIIALGQAFWVYATGAGASLTVTEQAKTSASGTFFRERTVNTQGLTLSLTHKNVTDNSFILVMDEASRKFDPEFDGYKLEGREFGIAAIDDQQRKLVSYALSSAELDRDIPVHVHGNEGEYQINISSINNFSGYDGLYLVDTYLRISAPLNSSTTYDFTITGNHHTREGRFFISKHPEDLLADENNLKVDVYPNPVTSTINVEINRNNIQSVQLMDNMGMPLANIPMDNVNGISTGQSEMISRPSGIYFIKVLTKDKITRIEKIVKID